MKRQAGTGAGLEIRLLGDLTLLRGERPVTLPASKKTRALLGYLAATGTPHRRERLCDLFWEGPDDPRAALRWSLTKLRPLVDESRAVRLVADRERVGFEALGASIDVDRIRSATAGGLGAASTESLAEVAAMFRGPFLEGLELPGCHAFQAWCVGERDELRTLHVAVRHALIDRLGDDPSEALRHARALIALDPLAEPAHIALIVALEKLGKIREALEQYERCRSLLETELSAKPSAALERVRMALGRGQSAPASGSGAVPVPAAVPPIPLAQPPAPLASPLVGREHERDTLQAMLDEARQGRGRDLLLLLGDPGVGKSRLLEELRAMTLAAGGTVLAGRAFEAELVRPYGAWIDALRPLIADAPATSPEVAALAPFVRPAEPSEPGFDQTRLFDGVAAFLRALAARRGPVVVILDDIQWFDEASVALLHFAVRAVEDAPVLFACAARAGELGDNPAALRLTRAFDRERRLRQLPVGALDAKAIAELLRAAAPGVDATQVFAECEGNPLFALEVARALRAGADEATGSLDSLIGDRLERLDERTRRVVPWAAALGRGFNAEILAAVTGLPNADLLAALDDLERRGVVRAAGRAGFDFVHDLVRRAAYRQMSEPRRRLTHLQTARALALLADPDGSLASDVAHHAALGGDGELAARASVTAGRRCQRLFALAEARALSRRGLEQIKELPAAIGLPLGVELLGLQVHPGLGARRARELTCELDRAIGEAEEAGLGGAVARAFYFRSYVRYGTDDTAGAAESSLRRMEAGRGMDAETSALHAAGAARCLAILERDMDRVEELLAEAARLGGSETEMLDAIWARGLGRHFRGDVEGAVNDLELARAITRRKGQHWEGCDCLIRLVLIELERGRYEAAQARCTELAQLAEKLVEGAEKPAAQTLAALARRAAGDPEAEAALEAGLDALRKADAKSLLSAALNWAAEQDLAMGAASRAEARAREALEAAEIVRRSSEVSIARALLANAALVRGDRAAAQVQLDALEADVTTPARVSARARAAVSRARAALASARQDART